MGARYQFIYRNEEGRVLGVNYRYVQNEYLNRQKNFCRIYTYEWKSRLKTTIEVKPFTREYKNEIFYPGPTPGWMIESIIEKGTIQLT